jgi:hypothetical protein
MRFRNRIDAGRHVEGRLIDRAGRMIGRATLRRTGRATLAVVASARWPALPFREHGCPASATNIRSSTLAYARPAGREAGSADRRSRDVVARPVHAGTSERSRPTMPRRPVRPGSKQSWCQRQPLDSARMRWSWATASGESRARPAQIYASSSRPRTIPRPRCGAGTRAREMGWPAARPARPPDRRAAPRPRRSVECRRQP